MQKLIIIAGVLVALAGAATLFFLRAALGGESQTPAAKAEGRLWDLTSRTLAGEEVALKDWEGQVALVVNVASKCGLTPQYEQLEALYRAKKDEGFVVLGFPSNDFMGQEPGTPEEIRAFCTSKYDVTFPLFTKVKVKGESKDGVYRWLTSGGLEEPTWNFTKYLVGRDGQVIARYAPKTTPDAEELTAAIDAALAR